MRATILAIDLSTAVATLPIHRHRLSLPICAYRDTRVRDGLHLIVTGAAGLALVAAIHRKRRRVGELRRSESRGNTELLGLPSFPRVDEDAGLCIGAAYPKPAMGLFVELPSMVIPTLRLRQRAVPSSAGYLRPVVEKVKAGSQGLIQFPRLRAHSHHRHLRILINQELRQSLQASFTANHGVAAVEIAQEVGV